MMASSRRLPPPMTRAKRPLMMAARRAPSRTPTVVMSWLPANHPSCRKSEPEVKRLQYSQNSMSS